MFLLWILFISSTASSAAQACNYLESSIHFFNAVKNNEFEKATVDINLLATATEQVLKFQLDTEAKAKAFWLNVYNTFVQYQLKRKPELFTDRGTFFKARTITIAQQKLSLDDIEHGIIRRSTNKYSFGYFARFFVSDFETRFRLKEIDYRIHFALNCGAISCPPVALYDADRIEYQLDQATTSYLKAFAKYDPSGNIVSVPALCSWYRGDFGGESGIISAMKKYGIVPPSKHPSIEYLPYDWTLQLSQYITL